MTQRIDFTRRSALALGASALAMPVLAHTKAFAGEPMSYIYNLRPVQIADGVWVVMGVADKITAKNGGAIANIAILDTSDGAVIVDTGPSHRYGMELAALSRQLTGKPVARVFVTHIHADHSLGATAFDPDTLYGPKGLAEDLKLRGNDVTNAMYRVAGDWMRGTNVPDLTHIASDGVEQIGQRKLHCLTLSGHTATDLCLYDDTSGLLFTGDLVFLDRAPTTPDADTAAWRTSLAKLSEIPHAKLVPGHGPIEPGARGIAQTHRWIDFVDDAVETHFNHGLDIPEMMQASMPEWTNSLAVSRFEVRRSVMDLLPKLEATQLPIVS